MSSSCEENVRNDGNVKECASLRWMCDCSLSYPNFSQSEPPGESVRPRGADNLHSAVTVMYNACRCILDNVANVEL